VELIHFLQNIFSDINKKNWEWEYNSKQKISPGWSSPLRIFMKSAHVFLSHEKWYNYEKKYLNYWIDNVYDYSMHKYKNIIKNNFNARNSIAWHTLTSENNYLQKTGKT